MITGSQIIRNFLVSKGHRIVSGYSGGAVLPLLNSIKQSDITFIKNANEQCSGHLAEGLSKSLNHRMPGIIITTSGPGITNCITPIYDAYSDGVPLIVLSGQVDQKFIGTDAFQEAPAVEATKPFTKLSVCVRDVDDLQNTLDDAYALAMEPRRGPVHIDLPKDVLIAQTHTPSMSKPKRTVQVSQDVGHVKELINASNRPIICFGQGGIEASLISNILCETFHIPFCSTIHGMGVVSEKSFVSMGMVGMHGSAAANYAIQKADLIIGIGNRFDDRTIGNIDGYAKGARKSAGGLGIVHVDNSAEQIKKVQTLFKSQDLALTSLTMDSKDFVEQLYKTIDMKQRTEWIYDVLSMKSKYKFHYNKGRKPKVQDVISRLDAKITERNVDRGKLTFTTGVGNHQMFTAQFITWTHPGKMLTSGSAGTMGVGLPFALGAKVANPKDTVICIDGDGSFNMTSSDLQTAVENNIPIKIMIMNDSRQQMVYVWQKLFFDENYIATENNKNPCYKSLAEAYGMKALRCDSFERLDDTLDKMLEYNDGPILCDYVVEPDICLPLVSPGKALDEMLLERDEKIDIDKKSIPS